MKLSLVILASSVFSLALPSSYFEDWFGGSTDVTADAPESTEGGEALEKREVYENVQDFLGTNDNEALDHEDPIDENNADDLMKGNFHEDENAEESA